jgi:hypothetical protein
MTHLTVEVAERPARRSPQSGGASPSKRGAKKAAATSDQTNA